MDPDTLYSPSFWSKRLPQNKIEKSHIEFTLKNSETLLDDIRDVEVIKYGRKARQELKIIGTSLKKSAKIFVYIHGGYWQTPQISGENYVYLAKNLHQNGIKTILVSYECCPDESLRDLVEKSVNDALNFVFQYAENNKSEGVHLCGHSAGAHLIASQDLNPYKNLLKSIILISGIYDLQPLLVTKYNEALKLNLNEAHSLSPIKNRENLLLLNKIVYLIVGGDESPAFLGQTKDFGNAMEMVDDNVKVLAGYDHFDIVERMFEVDSDVFLFIISKVLNNQ